MKTFLQKVQYSTPKTPKRKGGGGELVLPLVSTYSLLHIVYIRYLNNLIFFVFASVSDGGEHHTHNHNIHRHTHTATHYVFLARESDIIRCVCASCQVIAAMEQLSAKDSARARHQGSVARYQTVSVVFCCSPSWPCTTVSGLQNLVQ